MSYHRIARVSTRATRKRQTRQHAGNARHAPLGGDWLAPRATQLLAGAIQTPFALRHALHPRQHWRHFEHPSLTPRGRRFFSSAFVVTSEMSPTFTNASSESLPVRRLFPREEAKTREGFAADAAAAAAAPPRRRADAPESAIRTSSGVEQGNASAGGFSGSQIPARSRHVPHPYLLMRHFAHPRVKPIVSTARTAHSGALRPRRAPTLFEPEPLESGASPASRVVSFFPGNVPVGHSGPLGPLGS
jgi:hypothetical protein